MNHHGKSRHRLDSNQNEAVFAEAWDKEAPGTLPYLLHGQDKHGHGELTQAEATVAATVIQWLGSPVGSYFLDTVQEQIRKAKKAQKKARAK